MPSTTTIPTTSAPLDYPSALVARLTTEFGDAAIATQVVDALGADALARLEARVPLGAVATDPLLSYRPATVPAERIDSIVAYSFGLRDDGAGTLTPGPVNEQIAAAIEAFVTGHPVPVFAQWEIAEVLAAAGVPGVTSIEPDTAADGSVVYLSTAGVAAKAKALAAEAGIELGTVGVFGFADHLVRCVMTTEAAGMTAAVPAGVTYPSAYDPQSAQPWTRDRATYLTTDLLGRLATL